MINAEPVLLTKISITTGFDEETGMIPAEFNFRCALADDVAVEELYDWIYAFFVKRDQ
jgi:hypothetical protein